MVLGSNCGTVGLVRTGLVQPSCCCVVVLLWSSIIKNKMGNKACNIKKVDKTKVEEAGIKPATCRMRSDHSTPELHPLHATWFLEGQTIAIIVNTSLEDSIKMIRNRL